MVSGGHHSVTNGVFLNWIIINIYFTHYLQNFFHTLPQAKDIVHNFRKTILFKKLDLRLAKRGMIILRAIQYLFTTSPADNYLFHENLV